MKKIIIIGSGIGGSGIGALIATSVKSQITLFEQNNWIGGRCGSYIKKDKLGREWICDVGTHIFGNCDKGFLGEILNKIGRPDAVKWAYCRDPGPRINMMGNVLSFGLKKISNKTGAVKKKKTKKSKKRSFKEILDETTYEETYDLDDVPLINYLKEQKLNAFMYALQAGLMFGTPPKTTSAGEFLRCSKLNASTRSMGYCYGGTGTIPKAYCKAIEDNGGAVKLETKVNKIVVEDNTVVGVEVGPDNEYFESELVIANSDIKSTVLKLVGEKYFDRDYINYIKNLKWGGQVCSLKLGIDIHVSDDKWLNYIPQLDSEDMKILDPAQMGRSDFTVKDVPKKTVLMIVPISNLDPNLAPPGCQNLHTVTTTLGVNPNMEERKKISKRFEETCMNTLLDLYPQIEGHILWTDFVSDIFLETKLGKEGAGTGIGQIIGQVGKKRPSQKSPIKNLYYSSADAGGWGVGTELAAKSAVDLFEFFKNNKIV
ncbi:MAG: phytoene desaturase family protein [Candidatus Helarchaeota archaeon]